MENSIKFIPILTPTFEQWKSLPNYLIHHETSLQRRYGAAKILPPSRWIPLFKNPYNLNQIKSYIKQEIIPSSNQSDVFYIKNTEIPKRRSISYEEFKILAENDTYRLDDTINHNLTDYFWSTISTNISLHVPNIEDTLFSKRENIFNMSNLPSLLKYYPKIIQGVTTPYLHLGMWSNSLGIHIDEHDLISLNYLHSGAPKIWYIISPSSYSKFEELVNKLKLFSDFSSSCLSPLQHKTLVIKPSFLHLHSIEYYKIEQKLNELVVIFPGIYYFYFDTGFNLSETVKYALPSWLEFQRRSPRLCSCTIPSSIIVNLNRRFFTKDILEKFQQEYLISKSPTYIDLSLDDDENNNNNNIDDQTMIEIPNIETPVETPTDIDIQLDPLYSSSADLISTNEHEDIWNIFEQISSQTKTNSSRFHPYSSVIPCHTSTIYPTLLTPNPYSSLRMCINNKRPKRRKCYACRRQGHLRNECPYFSHQ